MPQANEKKVSSMSWEQIVMEAMLALSNGETDVEVTTEGMYNWIESTEYLTKYGRQEDVNWVPGVPSYRASLQLRWQRMVNAGKIYPLSQWRLSTGQTPSYNPTK